MVLLLLLSCFVLNVFGDPPGGYYHAKYDYLDLDDVLNNKRLVYHYANCLLSREPCPPQGMELKEILPEALDTTCMRCTEKQKVVILHTIRRLKMEYPDIWKEVGDMLDPTGNNFRKLEATFGGGGIDNPPPNDVAPNLLANRFGEDESANELAGSLKPTTTTTTPKPTKPRLTPRPPKVSLSTNRPSPTETVRTSSESTTFVPNVPTTPPRPVYWWVNNNGGMATIRWRPMLINMRQRPSWFGEVSSKVIEAGTQVASMVLSTVQAALGG